MRQERERERDWSSVYSWHLLLQLQSDVVDSLLYFILVYYWFLQGNTCRDALHSFRSITRLSIIIFSTENCRSYKRTRLTHTQTHRSNTAVHATKADAKRQQRPTKNTRRLSLTVFFSLCIPFCFLKNSMCIAYAWLTTKVEWKWKLRINQWKKKKCKQN